MKAAVIAVAILCAFGLASYAILGVVGSRASARDQRHDFCVEIENLKQAQRDKAWENFNRLDQNLRLLHLRKTKRIVRVAKQNRDTELRRFKARSCE